MALPDLLRDLGEPRQVTEVSVLGVGIELRGFEAKISVVDLDNPEREGLKNFLKTHSSLFPKTVTVIFDGDSPDPILALVSGERDVWTVNATNAGLSSPVGNHEGRFDYLKLISADPNNRNVFYEIPYNDSPAQMGVSSELTLDRLIGDDSGGKTRLAINKTDGRFVLVVEGK